jgi:hypothetical protein
MGLFLCARGFFVAETVSKFDVPASPGITADQGAALGLNTEGNTTFLRIYGISGGPGGSRGVVTRNYESS